METTVIIVGNSAMLVNSCIRLARRMNLDIIYKEDEFAIQNAIDDDDEYWFSRRSMNIDDYEQFVRMCMAYSKSSVRVPTADAKVLLDCPNCHKCVMTPKQVELNSLKVGVEQENPSIFIVCNNCGEVFKVIDNFTVDNKIQYKEIQYEAKYAD